MDFALVQEFITNVGILGSLLLGGLWVLWKLANKAGAAAWPLVMGWFADEKVEREKRTAALHETNRIQASHTTLLQDTNETVHSISDRQEDPESSVSNFHTNRKLNALAKAAIVAMEGLEKYEPRLHEHFDEAIQTLKAIEDR